MIEAVTAIVHGRVHGVGFRYATRDRAIQLGLLGWVRNAADGTVHTWAQGDPDAVESFVRFLERGPQAARVTDVQVSPATPDSAMDGFSVRF